VPVPCDTQLTRWKADVDAYHPDVVLMADGEYEVRDQLTRTGTTNILSAKFDAVERRAITRATQVLGSTGAPVVLLTAPYYHQLEQEDGNPWPEDDPARVNRYNALLAQVAKASGGKVLVADVGAKLDPGGHYEQDINGVDVRFSDGIHVTPAGATMIAPWLLRQVAALGQASRAAQASTTTTGSTP
jgi:hypothetical protein